MPNDNGAQRHNYRKIHTTLHNGEWMRHSQVFLLQAMEAEEAGKPNLANRLFRMAEIEEECELS